MKKQIHHPTKSLPITSTQELFKNALFRLFESMDIGSLTLKTRYDGESYRFGNGDRNQVDAHIEVTDPTFFKQVALYTDMGIAEAYLAGKWETESIHSVIKFFILNLSKSQVMSGAKGRFSLPLKLLNLGSLIGHIFRDNSIKNSRKNIVEHYDLSNELYKEFLDPSLTYSSAIFDNESDQDLEAAQYRKYKRLADKLKLDENDTLLEIGSGWGSMALFAAENYGCKVKTFTISDEQFRLAKERIEKSSVSYLIEIELLDYRYIPKHYGRIFTKAVSIEMVEAVGDKYMDKYAKVIGDCLLPDGLFAIQAITSPNSRYEEMKNGVDFIKKHIFPGSQLPSIHKLSDSFYRMADFDIVDLKDFGTDYSKTLNLWQHSFNKSLDGIKKLGFDERFIRKWNYYFSYCSAAFAMKNISVVQILFSRPNNARLK